MCMCAMKFIDVCSFVVYIPYFFFLLLLIFLVTIGTMLHFTLRMSSLLTTFVTGCVSSFYNDFDSIYSFMQSLSFWFKNGEEIITHTQYLWAYCLRTLTKVIVSLPHKYYNKNCDTCCQLPARVLFLFQVSCRHCNVTVCQQSRRQSAYCWTNSVPGYQWPAIVQL